MSGDDVFYYIQFLLKKGDLPSPLLVYCDLGQSMWVQMLLQYTFALFVLAVLAGRLCEPRASIIARVRKFGVCFCKQRFFF